jgi:hypothetical protein
MELLLACIINPLANTHHNVLCHQRNVKENCMVTLANRAQFHGQEELQSIDRFSNVGWLMIMRKALPRFRV